MKHIVSSVYVFMDKSLLKALSLVMALVLAGCIFWDPSRFAARTSGLEIWHALVMMWAVCAGVIHGVGLRLRTLRWQAVFCPAIAQVVLIAGLLFFFF